MVRDPELRYTPSGTAICEFTIANNITWLKDGEKKEKVNFVGCTCWGRRGEVVSEYFKKGKEILVKGQMDYQSWETKEGEKRSVLKIKVEDFEFLGGKADGASGGGAGREVGDATDAQQAQFPADRPKVEEEEIPF
jgi:single-strand DNA-binding protein